jgi:hypothetical protein
MIPLAWLPGWCGFLGLPIPAQITQFPLLLRAFCHCGQT